MSTIAASVKNHEAAFRRIVMFTLLYLIAPGQAMFPITDPDIWWHLRVGEWIVANRSVPFQDYFSAYGAGKPWFAYSWLFEVLVYAVHTRFGLTGIVWFTVAMALVITWAVHRLVRLAHLPLFAEVTLTALAVAAMKPLMSPRPWLFTILCFSVELFLISRALREGKTRGLWFLPLIFVLWVNVHVQFVYGLAILALLLFEVLLVAGLGRVGFRAPPSLSPKLLVSVTAISCLATLVSPYHIWIFRPIWEYVVQTDTFQTIAEFHPMLFRSPQDWIVLALTLAAVFVLGWQRKWSVFPMLLLLLGVALGFRARRDTWLLVLVAIWIIGSHLRHRFPGNSFAVTKSQIVAVGTLTVLALYSFSLGRRIHEANQRSVVAHEFPLDAVAYIKQNRLPGPIFNTLDWGGFLIWSLREIPVVIDGRTNLHGDERVKKFVRAWLGYPGWDADPEFLSARLIIADHHRPLTWLLRRDSRFKIAHEDRTAVVFVPAGSRLISDDAKKGGKTDR